MATRPTHLRAVPDSAEITVTPSGMLHRSITRLALLSLFDASNKDNVVGRWATIPDVDALVLVTGLSDDGMVVVKHNDAELSVAPADVHPRMDLPKLSSKTASSKVRAMYGKPLRNLGLKNRTANMLYRHGAATIGDVAHISVEELSDIPGMGTASLADVKARLRRFGITLRSESSLTA